jgi:hypothetical protein
MERQLEVSDINQLNNLLETDEVDRYYLKLTLDDLNSNHLKKFEKRLNKFKSSCGCEVGAYFLYSTLLGLITWFVFFNDFNMQSISFMFIIKNLSMLIFAAILGKIIGILFYKFMFRKTIMKINTILENKSYS